MEYNSQREPLLLKEYGRNVQKLVAYISTLDGQDTRTEYAYALIHLMKALNPSVKENADNPQRIWDHLYVMSDFKLDISGPYPVPEDDVMHKPPLKMNYAVGEVRFKNYGRNVEFLVEAALKIEEEEEQTDALVQIGQLMKTFYASWHNDVIEDKTIVSHMKTLSKGRADLSKALEEANGNLFERVSQRSTRNFQKENKQNQSSYSSKNTKTSKTPSNNRSRSRRKKS